MNTRLRNYVALAETTLFGLESPTRSPFSKLKPAQTSIAKSILSALVAVLGLLLCASGMAADLPVQDGLIVWLKADAVNASDTNQVRISGTDAFIKSWIDQSGNNHPASNSTDGDQPLYITGALNGLPVLRFAQDSEDNGDRLYLGDLSLYSANAGTIFAVATPDTDGRYNLFGNREGLDERWVADTWNESHPGSFRGGRASGTFTQSGWPTSGSHIFVLESDRSVYRVAIDGTEIGNDTADYHSGNGNWTIGNRSTAGQQLRGDIAEVIIYNHILTSAEANQVGKYLADKYAVTSAYVDATRTPQAKIYDFGLPGNPAIIDGTNITLTMPFLSDVSGLAPTYMISSGATCDKASGSPHNFMSPQTYTVVSSDLATTNVYTVTVIVRPAIISYDFNNGLQGWTQIWPAEGNGNVWENSALGSGGDNGNTRFARSPEFILHGLEDLTFQLRGGESPLAAPGVGPSAIPEIAIEGGGFGGVALRDVASDTYVLSKRRSGNSNEEWQNNRFTRSELASLVIPGRKYTLDYIDYNRGGWGWTYLDNVSIPGYGTRVQMQASDLGLLVGSNATLVVSIPQGFNATTPVIVYLTNSNPGAITINGSSAPVITLTYAAGPVYTQTLTLAATAVGQVRLTATSSGLDTANLALTVCPPFIGHWLSGAPNLSETSGFRAPGQHDGVAVGTSAALAFSSEVPPGCTGQSLDLRAGNVGVMITNSATTDGAYLSTYDDVIRNKFTIAFWAKGIPGGWSPWLCKRGEDGVGWQVRRMSSDPIAGFTVRGLDNDDGWGSNIKVDDNMWHHYAAVWTQAAGTRALYVDGVLSHIITNTAGQMMNLAPTKHLALGARQQGGTSSGFENYFAGLLYDVRLYSYPLNQSEVRGLVPAAIHLASRSAVAVGNSTTLTVSIPPWANASSPVTVYLTNGNPSRLNIDGAGALVTALTFSVGVGSSNTVTLSGVSAGQVTLAAGGTSLHGASATIDVFAAGAGAPLIGRWLAGAPHLADVSGFAGEVHDGSFIGVPPVVNFTNDAPLGRSGQSLDLRGAGNIAVRINNTRTGDASYASTYDDNIASQFSVAFWAKGFPDSWNPWVCKYGESGKGWQLRRWGGNSFACFTIRGLSNDDGTGSTIDVNNNNWHHFAGVWDQAAGTRALYVDGVLSHIVTNTAGQTMSMAPAAHLALGARGDESDNYGNWFKGLLYDVRMYNTPLAASDVLDLVGAVLVSPPSLSLVSPSPNTNLITIVVPPSVVATSAVNVVVTSDNPLAAIPVGAVGGVATITLPAGGANSTTFAVQAVGPGTAHFSYGCTLLPTIGTTTIAVSQPNIYGLVGYWNFDSQSLVETSGFQPVGTHDGQAIGSVAYVPGRLGGYAVDLRAANTAVRIKNTALADSSYRSTFDGFLFNSLNGFSFTCWVKGLPLNDWSSWLAKDGEATGYAVRKHGGGTGITFTLRNSDGEDDPYFPAGSINDNLWHHLAAVYDPLAFQRRVYLDGVEVINIGDTNLVSPPVSMPLMFGARDATGDARFAQVIIDEIRAYDKALSVPEITTEVGAPLITLTPNKWDPNLGDPDLTATITVPASMVATSSVTVTLTSANPAVANIVGAVGGSRIFNFAMGGASSASVAVHAVGLGSTTITGSSASSVVNGEISITVTPTPVLIGHWFSGAADLTETSGYKPAGTHDGVAAGPNASSLSFADDMPPNFTGQSLNLTASNVVVRVKGTANSDIGYQPTFDAEIATKFSVAFWAKGMPGEWGGWVTKLGENSKGWQLRRMGSDNIAGFTMRGIDNEDGWGSAINVNNGNWHHYVGIWDQASGTRKLYVDGVFSHTVYNNPSQAMSLAAGAHLIFGGLEDENGNLWSDRFVSCYLFDVRMYNAALSEGRIQSLISTPAVPTSLTIQVWPGSQVRISWPTASAGYALEQSSSVAGGWAASGLTVGVEGAENAAYAPLSGAPQFFRLKK